MKLRTATATNDSLNNTLDGLSRYFNHLWWFIECDKSTTSSQKKPTWRTEKKFKLDSVTLLRRFLATDKVIGTRFDTNKGSTTNYLMLDVDCHSLYHPYNDPLAFARLLEALEDAGLAGHVLVRSSASQGLHIYLSLSKGLPVFTAACWLEAIVTGAGFKIDDGQLECFPNTKKHGKNHITNYQAHRLPLQPDSGSVLLDDDLNPISDNFLDFIAQMDFVATYKNIIDDVVEVDALQARESITMKRVFQGKNSKSIVAEWKADLEFHHQLGWTGQGQTNTLLCKFATYGRVFLGLEHEDLVQYIIETALSSSGYQEHCRHKHEIERRSRERARGAMQFYWKLGDVATRQTTFRDMAGQEIDTVNNGNEAKAYNAVERMEKAIAFMKKANLPVPTSVSTFMGQISQISKDLFGTGVSTRTFYKATVNPILLTAHAALLSAQLATASPIDDVLPEAIDVVVNSPVETLQANVIEAAPIDTEDTTDKPEAKTAETRSQQRVFTPLTEISIPEPLKPAASNEFLHLALYEGFEGGEDPNSKNNKNSSPFISPTNQSATKKPRPILKSEHKQRLSLDREQRLTAYYAEAQQRHASIKALDDQLKTPEYKSTSATSLAAIRQILDRARATFRRGDPSTLP